VAGILPQRWQKPRAARDTLSQYTTGHGPTGTLVELGKLTSSRAKILERFERLAGLLCVFGRALRLVSIVGRPAVAKQSAFSWEPEEFCPGIEHGKLRLVGDWGTETNAICVRTPNGDLLLALGPKGFRPLPEDVPTLWVTAPIREKAPLGFAVNGRFDLDAGRTNLAANSETNRTRARQLGAAAGAALVVLFEQTRTDWPAAREAFGLLADLPVHDFWHGIWVGLTEGWLRRSRNEAAELAREVALALIQRMSQHPGAIPTGLMVPFQALTSREVLRYELEKGLTVRPVLAALGSWEHFTAKYLMGSIVSESIAAILKHADLSRPTPLGLAALLGVLNAGRAQPCDARVLGRVLLLTEQDPGWASDEVKKRLGGLRFRTADDTWLVAAQLVAGAAQGVDKDEVLRYDLAPPGRRLHPDYLIGEDGATATVAFFLLARDRLQAGTGDLAQWVLAAQDEKAQKAALLYLVKGQLCGEVARRVRGQGWLAEVPRDESWLRDFEPDQRKELRRLLAADEQIDRGLELDLWSEPAAPLPTRIDLSEALGRIDAWWSQQGTALARDHRQRLYPAGGVELAIDTETGRFDRSSWLILLALGAFQTIPRTREAQHRGFIEHCQGMGWWQTFSEVDPKLYPNKWMDIIEDYAEGQHDDEQWSQWIAQFPKLYRLARWLDDYVELFLSVDRYTTPFSLDSLRTPRASFVYQGGGIDAPPLNRTLKVGGPLVIRELLHHGVIASPLAIPHAYAPVQRIRDWFSKFREKVETSKEIHDLLRKHLGEERATFGGAYDIPLRIAAADDDL
jgi:hypothetical protein